MARVGPVDDAAGAERLAAGAGRVGVDALRAGVVHRHQSVILREGHARFVAVLRTLLVKRLPPDVAKDQAFVDAIDLLISFEVWHRLRWEQRLSPAQARQVIYSTVNALLDQRERTRGKS